MVPRQRVVARWESWQGAGALCVLPGPAEFRGSGLAPADEGAPVQGEGLPWCVECSLVSQGGREVTGRNRGNPI